MRFALAVVAVADLAGCAAQSTESGTPPPQPIDTVWADTIRDGDLIAMVPGTGSLDALATPIEAVAAQTHSTSPIIDVRQNATVAGDAVVLEQAIAAAHRAGYEQADIESGNLTFGMWGAGFTTVHSFEYISYEGIHVHVVDLGGENSCATGSIFANLLGYNATDAITDANNLYADIQTYLAANPSSTGAARNVIVASHSWGGALSEYMTDHIGDVIATHGPLADTDGVAQLPFMIADGVPGFILGYTTAGPGLHEWPNGLLYEVDRPDDPVHAMDPSGDGDGHMYNILIGSDFVGSYGVTTEQLACAGVAGECPVPAT
jgi:hypothetical protein